MGAPATAPRVADALELSPEARRASGGLASSEFAEGAHAGRAADPSQVLGGRVDRTA